MIQIPIFWNTLNSFLSWWLQRQNTLNKETCEHWPGFWLPGLTLSLAWIPSVWRRTRFFFWLKQLATSELPFASVLKQGQVQSLSFQWKLVLFTCKWTKICVWIKRIFKWKALHQDSLWNRDERQLGNGLYSLAIKTKQNKTKQNNLGRSRMYRHCGSFVKGQVG